MSINGAIKAGWFLIGFGVGAFAATMLVKKELEKPIGEFEEYIPIDDREGFKEVEHNSENREVRKESDSNRKKDISTQRDGRNGREPVNGRSSRHNDRKEDDTEFSAYKNAILHYKSSSKDATRSQSGSREDQTRKEFNNRNGEVDTKRTRYSRMYQDEAVEKVLHAENSHRGSRNSYDNSTVKNAPMTESYYDEDSPSDDDYVVSPVYETDLHDEYTLERVEDNIEIFLGDNPQDFVTMVFYEGDNTLCDDGEQIVPNAEEVIGLAALSRLIEGGPGAENGVIFVHNLKTSLNYEVVLDAGSYQDTVIGQFESHLNEDGGRGGYS